MNLRILILKFIMRLPDRFKIWMSGGEPVTIGGRRLNANFQLLAYQAAKSPPMSSLPADVARAGSAAGLAMLAAPDATDIAWRNDTIPSRGSHQIPVRIYTPEHPDAELPVMVYFHFGGGVIGDLETSHTFCQILARQIGCPVVSVDYRLAPEHKFPAGLEDAIDAYEWCLKNAESLGARPGHAAVGGDSMGGNLSAVISQDMRRQEKPMPDLQLLIYPATDLTAEFPSRTLYGETYPLSSDTMDWFMQQYVPDGDFDRSQVLLSPGLEPRLAGLPNAIIATAGFDPLVDDGAAYAEKLKDAGVPVTFKCYDELAHAFTAFTNVVPAAKDACVEIADLVREELHKIK